MAINYAIEYPKLQQKCQRLQARVEALEGALNTIQHIILGTPEQFKEIARKAMEQAEIETDYTHYSLDDGL